MRNIFANARRYVIGGIAGAALMFSVTAYGANIGKVGKVIQAEVDVTVDGKQLPVNAIAVDGTAYAPLRAFGDATGYNVAYSKKGVDFTKKEVTEPVNTTTPTPTANENSASTVQEQIAELDKQREKILEELLSWGTKYDLSKLTAEQKKESEEMKRQIDDLQNKIDALKTQSGQ